MVSQPAVLLSNPAPPAPTKTYDVMRLAELAADAEFLVDGRPAVEWSPFRPSATLELPPFMRGHLDLDRHAPHVPPANGFTSGAHHRPEIFAYVLRNALVHGRHGIISVGDRVVQETLYHAPLHSMPGASRLDETHVRLPDRPLIASVPHAYHLLAGNLNNYFHWLVDVLSRFRLDLFEAAGGNADAGASPVLLVPEGVAGWQRESLGLVVPATVPRVALATHGYVLVDRLIYLPDLSGGAFMPHPALLHMFDRLRDAAMGTPPPSWRPWRRLYISRSDSGSRKLENEAEVAAHAERAGFQPVVLSKMSVAAQIWLFAEASHIVAPHGAGLTNIGFCQPGASLCELHMDAYRHWAFRRLAALRGMRYDCLVGKAREPHVPWPHHNTWRLDLDELDAMLADPRFVANDAPAAAQP